MGPIVLYIVQTPLANKMVASEVPQETRLCIILAKMKNGKSVEVASTTMCSFTQQLELVQPILLLRLF